MVFLLLEAGKGFRARPAPPPPAALEGEDRSGY
jgi:hypothetical protein